MKKKTGFLKNYLAKQLYWTGIATLSVIMTHAFSLKKIFLEIYRRRWKEPGSERHYSNTYNLYPPGMKTTKAFGDFLKEIGG